MKKYFLSLICIISFYSVSLSQTNELDKKLEKVYYLADKGKLDDADEYLVKVLEKNPGYGKGWDLLATIRRKAYNNSKLSDNALGGNFIITTKDKNGKEVKSENDSLAKALTELLNGIKPSKIAYNKYIYTMKKATLFSDDCHQSSALLRNILVDTQIDTAINEKALKYFDEAEEEFGKKNYDQAAKLYKRALEAEPQFYKASLYLGDSYYFMKRYIDAIAAFKESSTKFPELLEPRKYLTDAYIKEKLYDKALQEAINTMAVYPDLSMFSRIQTAAYYNDKKLDIKWISRAIFPNKIASDSKKELNTYSDPKEPQAKAHWVSYKNALDKISSYCNSNGVITKSNSITDAKYLEVYSWKEMISTCKDDSLDEAKRMEKDGFLDCYVFITCFHQDIYEQYKHFVAANPNKIQEYFDKYIVKK